MRQQLGLIGSANTIVKVAFAANRLFLGAVFLGLGATAILPGFFLAMLRDPGHAPDALVGVRLLLLIGIVMAVAGDRLLAALGAIVASAQRGDPFVPGNGRRLRTIGWALLVLQLLDIPCTLLARSWPSLGAAAPAGGISIGGWIATLMTFVLARIFAAGTMMRDDLAGTV